MRDRQKSSDSLLHQETVRRDRTLCPNKRPSEETGLFATPRDRQKRPDSLLHQETVRRDRTLCYTKRPPEKTGLYSKLQDCCSSSPTARVERSEILTTINVELPLYTHQQRPQCNARKDHRPAVYYPPIRTA